MQNEQKNIFKILRESTFNKKTQTFFSARELAEAMGKPNYFPVILNLENEKKEPTVKDLKLYKEYFNVEYNVLLGDEKNDSGVEFNLSKGAIKYLRYISNSDYTNNTFYIVNKLLDLPEGHQMFELLQNYVFISKDEYYNTVAPKEISFDENLDLILYSKIPALVKRLRKKLYL